MKDATIFGKNSCGNRVQESNMTTAKKLLYDPTAPSTDPNLPGFLARPAGTPVYHGFPVIPETETDGWLFGAITAYDTAEPQTEGDGYVIAPDGSRAGIVWANGTNDFYEIMPPDCERWGVYGVRFPRPVSSLQDIVFNFRAVLPKLKERFAQIQTSQNDLQSSPSPLASEKTLAKDWLRPEEDEAWHDL
jgi:hypothetical protein